MMGLAKLAATKVKDEVVYQYLKQNYPADTLKWVKNSEWTLEEVPLEKIKMDRRPGGPREKEKVKNIAAAFSEGKKMEPVVLIRKIDGTHKIADGYHRTLGCKHSEKKNIKAWVGRVIQEDGPWDKEMHERKLNVGKSAFETFEEFEKEAALLGGIARLGGKMVKSTGKEVKNFGKGITGIGTKGAKNTLNTVKGNPNATPAMLSDAKKGLRKERFNQTKSWGLAGVVGATAGANKLTENANQQNTSNNPGLQNINPIPKNQ